ncbi:glycosyltransferase [Tamlana crocina]
MKFLIITHVEHKSNGTSFSAYAPYVREMNLWLKHVENLTIVAPQTSKIKSEIDLDYKHENIKFNEIPSIQFTDLKNAFVSLFKIPIILIGIYKACNKADHIHLRCPGNIGLLGCLVQIFFPKKNKTAKYAGNWDPNAKQPLSYRIQKWMLSNTFLTKNMSVLVYGNWENQTQNIKPFFTATFKENEIEPIEPRDYSGGLQFVFVGTLVEGKRPSLAIQIIERLQEKGKKVRLDIFGDGVLRGDLEDYVKTKGLNHIIQFHGNQEKQKVKNVLKRAHFLILPSKSEGWPKVIAEAMFFGTIPIATSISCLPDMLGFGNRGILIKLDLDAALEEIERHLNDTENLKQVSKNAANWSQNYTLDFFETEIVKLLKA